jgi:hypothetical protein
MAEDVQAQRGVSKVKVDRHELETLAGRCIHAATVMVEGRGYITAFYKMMKARRTTADGTRVKPGTLSVAGEGEIQKAYQCSLDWWLAALGKDMSVPLAPRLTFPKPGEEGCALAMTDAAREDGTGMGGFAPFINPQTGQRQMLVVASQWPADVREALQNNELSMPAGELFALACVVASVSHHVRAVTHCVVLTDSDATRAAINSDASGSPQLQAILLWLREMCPELQLLAVWLPGVVNTRADGLSRGVAKAGEVVAEAAAAGWQPCALPLPPHALSHLRTFARIPQRH